MISKRIICRFCAVGQVEDEDCKDANLVSLSVSAKIVWHVDAHIRKALDLENRLSWSEL